LDGFALTKFFKNRSCERLRNATLQLQYKVQLTELIFRACLEFLVCHQVLHTSGNGLDVVDNQLIEIGILFPAFDEEPIPEALASDIRIRLGYVYE
jgi:hypothetical protein